jgi:hypothetical protein
LRVIAKFRHLLAGAGGRPLADAPLPARPRKRYSLAGSIGFERRIASDQKRVAEQVQALLPPDHFRALFLCGAYGRGEGVRLRGADGKEVADRYEYGVIVGRTDARLRAAIDATLRRLAEARSATTGVPMRFRLLREEQLRDRLLTFPQADLRWSGRLLCGDGRVIEQMTERPFEQLAAGEMLWQHLEQGLGLLQNQAWLRSATSLGVTERARFFRHLIETVLSCGDLRLAVVGRYHPSHAEKLARLAALEQRHHRKFMTLYALAHRAYAEMDVRGFEDGHPLDWQARVAWLWLDALRRFEQWRAGGRLLPTWDAYCRPRPHKGQMVKASLGDRVRANLASFGPGVLRTQPRWALRHPRERLIGAMPLLLGGPQTAPEPIVAAALMLPPGTSLSRTIAAFLELCEAYRD